jgi:PhnB protein
MARAAKPIPEGYQTITPMLSYDDCARAMDWCRQALGAQELSRHTGPDGKIMHAEIQIGNSRIMMHDAMMGYKGAKSYGGSPANLWVYVENCDDLFERAVKTGGQVTMPMADQFWGDRCGSLTDPEGVSWTIACRIEDLTPEELRQRSEEFFKQFAGQQQPQQQTKTAGSGA